MLMRLIVMLCSLMTVSAQATEMYRWTDQNGVVNYSNEPPPGHVQGVKKTDITPNVIDGQGSYNLKMSMKKSPVVLFSGDCGAACREAKTLLDKRGIPYTLRDPDKDKTVAAALGEPSDHIRLPDLKVGDHLLRGFETKQWNDALDTAQYPRHPIPGDQRGAFPPVSSSSTPTSENAASPTHFSDRAAP
ncbi:MAG: glutaredoxin family protein [Betaproteobacteria bacterium]|nr:glutaredoxin family protein [Betaproteobacteria bacterium]